MRRPLVARLVVVIGLAVLVPLASCTRQNASGEAVGVPRYVSLPKPTTPLDLQRCETVRRFQVAVMVGVQSAADPSKKTMAAMSLTDSFTAFKAAVPDLATAGAVVYEAVYIPLAGLPPSTVPPGPARPSQDEAAKALTAYVNLNCAPAEPGAATG